MGLFSNNRKGKGSHPFFHKSAKSTVPLAVVNTNPTPVQRTTHAMLFVKQYDIMTILKEILMPQNQN
ncbi:hypothetical protein [Sphingobacterium sp. HMA12]|uniref:hypothetical protein n=1 Tax=Sphingobacterium sp. HMA12 TaxID=2050894 RepID=UPI000CE9B5E1|nr:hypothetical protein [Sphingobacterium sp. HMA12]